MKKDDIIEKNLTLTFDFLHEVIRNPDMINEIPNGTEIEFVQKDIPIIEHRVKATKKPQFYRVKHSFEKIK
jgi:hypothetical protein